MYLAKISRLLPTTWALARQHHLPLPSQVGSCCYFGSISKKASKKIPEDLLHYLHGRRGNERVDSVSTDMLKDRRLHQNRIALVEPQSTVVKFLEKAGFGSKKYRESFETVVASTEWDSAEHLTSASSNWPVFKHMLPEIAVAGHSNCGKSTLVNVMAGFSHREGPASVSDRAGWTDQICFYEVGKRPPVLILADLPGYGHAVASTEDVQAWKTMTRNYLRTRQVVSRCLVLVDGTRGLCDQDKNMIRFLSKFHVPWQVILTKADLLSVEDLARCVLLIENDLLSEFGIGSENLWSRDPEDEAFNRRTVRKLHHRLVLPVSANHGSGVFQLWRELKACAYRDTIEGRVGKERMSREEPAANLSKVNFRVEGGVNNSGNKDSKNDGEATTNSPAKSARVFVDKLKSAQAAVNGSAGALEHAVQKRRASERKILAELMAGGGGGGGDNLDFSRFNSGEDYSEETQGDNNNSNSSRISRISSSNSSATSFNNSSNTSISNNSKMSGSNTSSSKPSSSHIAGISEIEACLENSSATIINSSTTAENPRSTVDMSKGVLKKDKDKDKNEKAPTSAKANSKMKKKIVDEDDFVAFEDNGSDDIIDISRRTKKKNDEPPSTKKIVTDRIKDPNASFDSIDIDDEDRKESFDSIDIDDEDRKESNAVSDADLGDKYGDALILDNSVWGQKLLQLSAQSTPEGERYEDIFGVRFMKAASGGPVREHYKAGLIRRESHYKKLNVSTLTIKDPKLKPKKISKHP